MTSAELWVEKRNLSLLERRETLIYILGRMGHEPLPPELWLFLATHSSMWVHRPEGHH